MNEINLLIEEFLKNLKADFLSNKIAKETRDKKDKFDQLIEKTQNNLDYELIEGEKKKLEEAIEKARKKIQPKADKKYELNIWFNAAYTKAKPYITTHPAKFTNPKIENFEKGGVSSLLFYGDERKDGYFKTGNVRLDVKIDVSGNSATNAVIFELYSLLEKQQKDRKKVINLFDEDDLALIELINFIGINYLEMKGICIEVFYGREAKLSTHEMVRQVYFPINGGQELGYHLLSIIPASMLLFEIKRRIESYDRWIDRKNVRNLKRENKFYPRVSRILCKRCLY